MTVKRINEGLGDLASNIGGAIKTDIMKNSGPWEGLVNSLLKDPIGSRQNAKKNVDKIPQKVEVYKPIIPDYAQKQKEHLTFKKFSGTNKIDDVLKYLKDIKLREELYAYWCWSYYIDVYIDKINKDIAVQTILFDIVMNIKEDKMKIEKIHYDELQKLIMDFVVNEVESKKAAFDAQVKKMPKKIPESTQGGNMSFKSFNESVEKKLKEDNLSSLQAKDAQEQKKVADAQKNAANTKAKLTQAQLVAQKKAADAQAKQAKQTPIIPGMVAEGVYAGGDGKPKKIPFTQNPELQSQAVGPKTKANGEPVEDEEVEDEEAKKAKERTKKLDKLSKELQDLADEADRNGKDNIDATEDNLIDKMAAKEQKDLKESKDSWTEMEKKLQQLDEGCVGGVCTMGGRSDSAGGPVGNWGIAPIGKIGQLSMPGTAQSQPQIPQVADRASIYSFIKNNDLMRTSRDYALNALLSQFGNSSTELSQILSDAILSDGNPTGIDQSYGYGADSLLPVGQDHPTEDLPVDYTQDRPATQDAQMRDAWGQMEETLKEL